MLDKGGKGKWKEKEGKGDRAPGSLGRGGRESILWRARARVNGDALPFACLAETQQAVAGGAGSLAAHVSE